MSAASSISATGSPHFRLGERSATISYPSRPWQCPVLVLTGNLNYDFVFSTEDPFPLSNTMMYRFADWSQAMLRTRLFRALSVLRSVSIAPDIESHASPLLPLTTQPSLGKKLTM